MFSKSQSRYENQEDKDNNSDKRCHHCSTDCLTEIPKLVADGQPIGARIPVVS